MKKKIKYLKEGQATYCCKGQVLIHLTTRCEGHRAYFNTTHNKVCGDRKEWEVGNTEEARNNSRP